MAGPNLSDLSAAQIEAMRAVLRGDAMQAADGSFEIIASRSHGHVQAVAACMQRLGFAGVVGAKASRERDLVTAMVAARIVAPQTKLATTRWWQTTTLAEQFGVADASEDDLYAAMDWLLARQGTIEKKLAGRHLHDDFGIERMVMVGDRGMISGKAIEELREADGIGWITALRSAAIRALVEQGHLQLDLFDETNLLEISSPDFPGERLVACRNPQLAKKRAHTREDLLAATEVNSFSTLMSRLATIVRNTCRTAGSGSTAPTFEITTTPNPAQLRALGLIEAITL